MASKDTLPYGQRAAKHPNPLARKLFEIADRKKTNLVLAADVDTSKELLAMADSKYPNLKSYRTGWSSLLVMLPMMVTRSQC